MAALFLSSCESSAPRNSSITCGFWAANLLALALEEAARLGCGLGAMGRNTLRTLLLDMHANTACTHRRGAGGRKTNLIEYVK